MEACMCKKAQHMAVWGDRLEMGRLEKIRACPRVAVRLTLGGTPQEGNTGTN